MCDPCYERKERKKNTVWGYKNNDKEYGLQVELTQEDNWKNYKVAEWVELGQD